MKLVKLPASSPNGKFELINPESVSAIISSHDSDKCLLMLNGHSEDGGYWILLSQDECAKRLGIEVAS